MRTRTWIAAALFAVTAAGCYVSEPPTAPAPRPATSVSASFDAVWDATIDHFAEGNIPIATIERVSGIIASARVGVGAAAAQESSDCGMTGNGFGPPVYHKARTAVYNVLVRGDGDSATVRITISWLNPDSPFECVTTGVWERETEMAIKLRAEN